jgi:hypothetical protein
VACGKRQRRDVLSLPRGVAGLHVDWPTLHGLFFMAASVGGLPLQAAWCGRRVWPQCDPAGTRSRVLSKPRSTPAEGKQGAKYPRTQVGLWLPQRPPEEVFEKIAGPGIRLWRECPGRTACAALGSVPGYSLRRWNPLRPRVTIHTSPPDKPN